MPINVPRGKKDKVIDAIIEALTNFSKKHPRATIDLYRQNPASVRIRVIDVDFQGQGKAARNKLLWTYLEKLPDPVQGDISTLILLTPDEAKQSLANLEFEDPVPSQL